MLNNIKTYFRLILVIIFIALIVSLFLSFKALKSQKKENERLSTNQTSYFNGFTEYKDKYGKSIAEVQAITLKKNEFESLCKEQKKDIDNLNIKVKNLQSYQNTVIENHYLITAPIKDSIIINNNIIDTINCINYRNNYISISGCFINDSLNGNINTIDTLIQTVSIERKLHISALYEDQPLASEVMVRILAANGLNNWDTLLRNRPIRTFKDDTEYTWKIIGSCNKNISLIEALDVDGSIKSSAFIKSGATGNAILLGDGSVADKRSFVQKSGDVMTGGLKVNSYVTASGFIIPNGTSTQLLTADGNVLSKSTFASSSHTHSINDITDLQADLNNKVDVVTGKGLSTNDFTDNYKGQVDSNTAARHTHSNKTTLDDITAAYTTAEKIKLANIEASASVNTVLGIKGNSETIYRSGSVNLTAANIGALPMTALNSYYTTTSVDNLLNNKQNVTLSLTISASAIYPTYGTYTVENLFTTLSGNVKYLFGTYQTNDVYISGPATSSVQISSGTNTIPTILNTFASNISYLFNYKQDITFANTTPTASSTQITAGNHTIPTMFKTAFDNIKYLFDNAYSLPTATNSVLGGIKVGTNLSITTAGVLSANNPTWTDVQNRPTNLSQFANDVGYVNDSVLVNYGDGWNDDGVNQTDLLYGFEGSRETYTHILNVLNSQTVYMNTPNYIDAFLIGKRYEFILIPAVLSTGMSITITNTRTTGGTFTHALTLTAADVSDRLYGKIEVIKVDDTHIISFAQRTPTA
jgi:hypothetical protein